ncbi:MAG: TrkA family potassium uptake protein [Bacilli bacterium]|nr:TrkA family potassium uptake protein [Bacilli bacterium]
MKKFLIIGMGEFGTQIANQLMELGNEVCVVDNDYEKVNAIKDVYSNALKGDCLQLQTLKELGVKDYQACVVTVGDNFQNSLEITNRLKEAGAKYVVVKSYSDIQSRFLKMAGADEIAFPEKESALKLAATLSNTKLKDFVKISDEYGIYQVQVPNSWINRQIVELNIRKKYKVNVLAVKQNLKVFVPEPDYVFTTGDSVYVFGTEKNIGKLI